MTISFIFIAFAHTWVDAISIDKSNDQPLAAFERAHTLQAGYDSRSTSSSKRSQSFASYNGCICQWASSRLAGNLRLVDKELPIFHYELILSLTTWLWWWFTQLIGLLLYDLFRAFPDIYPEIKGDTHKKQWYTKNNNVNTEEPLAPLKFWFGIKMSAIYLQIMENMTKICYVCSI